MAVAHRSPQDQPLTHDPRQYWADRLVLWVMTHWLALLLIGMFIFTFLPFLAPLFMALGWNRLGEAIYTLYIPFCHQLPQRSWFFFGNKFTYTLSEIEQVYGNTDPWALRFFYGSPQMGWKVAWSDRMISFYTMTPVFGLLYAALRRWVRRPLPFRIFLLLLMPMALDGFTHAISDAVWGISAGGFRDSNAWMSALTGNALPGFYAGDQAGTFNWWMRLVTGLWASVAVVFWAFPWLDRLLRHERTRLTDPHSTHRPKDAL